MRLIIICAVLQQYSLLLCSIYKKKKGFPHIVFFWTETCPVDIVSWPVGKTCGKSGWSRDYSGYYTNPSPTLIAMATNTVGISMKTVKCFANYSKHSDPELSIYWVSFVPNKRELFVSSTSPFSWKHNAYMSIPWMARWLVFSCSVSKIPGLWENP